MKKILITITGRTCSGKTTLAKDLEKSYGMTTVKSYTTRPMREEEKNGGDHTFISEDEFDNIMQTSEIVAYTEINGYRYCATAEQLENNDIYIIDPVGLRMLQDKYGDRYNIFSIFLDIDKDTCRNRAKQRGQTSEWFEKRWDMEEQNFKDIYTCTIHTKCPKFERTRLIYSMTEFVRWNNNNSPQTHLFLDFDGVISDTVSTIVRMYDEDFMFHDDYKKVSPSEIKTWNFRELDLMDNTTLKGYFDSARFARKMKFYDYFFKINQIMESLFEIDYRIHVVTLGSSANLKMKENLVIPKLKHITDFIGLREDTHIDKSCVDMNGGVFVDDRVNNLLTSNAADKIVFGKEYPWNKYTFDMRRIDTWDKLWWYLVKRVFSE